VHQKGLNIIVRCRHSLQDMFNFLNIFLFVVVLTSFSRLTHCSEVGDPCDQNNACTNNQYCNECKCSACDVNASSGSCTAMSPGTCAAGYTSANNGATCTACVAGTYKASAGNVACTGCDTGYTTAGGTTTGATAQSQCSECAAGYGGTSSGGTTGCTACTVYFSLYVSFNSVLIFRKAKSANEGT
jgi:hypothetical protein